MAKKMYLGVSGSAKEVKNFYVGVNGQPKKVIKAYVGVGGQPKVFWDITSPTPSGGSYWKYYNTTSGRFLWTQLYNRTFSKINDGIAYYAIFKGEGSSGRFYSPLIVSPDPNAVTYTTSWGGTFTYHGTITIGDTTWYWGAWDYAVYGALNPYPTGYTPDCLLSDNFYFHQSSTDDAPARDLLANIYSDCFSYDYQEGYTYDLSNTASIEQTIRRFIGIYLYRNALNSRIHNAYLMLCDYIEDIVNFFIEQANGAEIIIFEGTITQGSTIYLSAFYARKTALPIDLSNLTVSTITTNFSYKDIEFSSALFHTSTMASVEIYDDSSMRYTRAQSVSIQHSMFTGYHVTSNNTIMYTTNVGVTL